MHGSPALLATVHRSGRVESEHYGHLVVASPSGEIHLAYGDPESRTYMRSAAKPFQAITTLKLGCAEKFHWGMDEIAVICASHTGDDEHLRLVRSILAKAGLSPGDLRCGPHLPVSASSRNEMICAHLAPTPLHNNCSGKHAGMLAACRLRGWPIETYAEASHPLQQENLATVAHFTGLDPQDVTTGIDGCGVPSFFLSLRAMATAFARLAESAAIDSGKLTEAKRVFDALVLHPSLIAGEGRFNMMLNRFLAGKGIGKGGAEGVFGVSLTNPPLGIALKVADGSSRCHPAVLAGVLQRYHPDLDWSAYGEHCNPPLRNTRGEVIGMIQSTTGSK